MVAGHILHRSGKTLPRPAGMALPQRFTAWNVGSSVAPVHWYIVSWECTVVGSTTRDNRVEVPCKAEFVASDGSLRQRQQP